MNELIKVADRDIGGVTVQTINARELHAFLEVGKVFGAWIQERIEQYQFEQGSDFMVYSDSGKNPEGGRPTKDYAVSLDMAKELAMVERNEKGKQARLYFIDCERRAKLAAEFQLPKTRAEALRLAADLEEKNAALTQQLAVVAPKADALDRLATATDGAVCLRVAAKLMQMTEKAFLHFLNAEGWIFRHHHSGTWQGYADKAKAGLLELKVTRVTRDDGSEKTVEQVLITRAGLAKLAAILERRRVPVPGRTNGAHSPSLL